MLNIKLQAPLTNPGSWGEINAKGHLEVSGNFGPDSDLDLLEEYGNLKKQLNRLLDAAGSELKLIENLAEIEALLARKQQDLRYIEGKILAAKKQLDRLAGFLRRLGINPQSVYLEISDSYEVEPATLGPLAIQSSDDDDDDDA